MPFRDLACGFCLLVAACGGRPTTPAPTAASAPTVSVSTTPPASPAAPPGVKFAAVEVIPDPEPAILVHLEGSDPVYLADPYEFQLWRPFSGHRVELRVMPCPPKHEVRGGRHPLCVRSWRDVDTGEEMTEVGPLQNFTGRFADAVVPKGRKAEGEHVLTFTSGSSTFAVGHVPAAVPQGNDVQIQARVVDVKRSYSAMVTGPRLWVVSIGNK